MKEKKCEIGETNFIYPPRPCAPNLWKDGFEMEKKKYSCPTFWGKE